MDLGGEGEVGGTAEDEPGAMGLLLNLQSSFDETVNGPTFGEAIFSPGVEREDWSSRSRWAGEAEFGGGSLELVRSDGEEWRQRVGVGSEGGGEVEIGVDVI